MSVLYRGKFLAYLAEAACAGTLQFAGATAPLATPSGFAAFLEEQRSKDWVVHVKPPFGSPEQVLKYLARYTHRVAISDRRIKEIGDDTVSFDYLDRKSGDRRVMTLDGVEFLRRFLLHVLPTGFVRIRYYGLLGNRARTQNLARCRELLAALPSSTSAKAPSSTSAENLIEHDAHRCPVCGDGELRWVAILARAPLPEMDVWAEEQHRELLLALFRMNAKHARHVDALGAALLRALERGGADPALLAAVEREMDEARTRTLDEATPPPALPPGGRNEEG